MKCDVCGCESTLTVNGFPMCKYCFAWGILDAKQPLVITTTKAKNEVSVHIIDEAVGGFHL